MRYFRSILMTILAMFFLTPVAAYANDSENHPAGQYCGRAKSSGEMAYVKTTLETGPDGLARGTYVFYELGKPVDGTLREMAGNRASLTRTFIWYDKYGSGRLIVHFSADFRNFDGKWGADTDEVTEPWSGTPCNANIS